MKKKENSSGASETLRDESCVRRLEDLLEDASGNVGAAE
jgi:hypothetical protein